MAPAGGSRRARSSTSFGAAASPGPRTRSSSGSAAYADVGATRVYLQVLDLDDLAMIELIASRVLPQLR